ncbi:MAG: hypothetical protein PVG03_11260 [Desulfarculaceae bacterium]|jgi:hypothetical protein
MTPLTWLKDKHEELHEQQPEPMRSFLDHCRLNQCRVTVGSGNKTWVDVEVMWVSPGRQLVMIREGQKVALVRFDWIETVSGPTTS